MPDVDIDFFDREKALKLFKHTPASIIKEEKIEKHKTGVYFHNPFKVIIICFYVISICCNYVLTNKLLTQRGLPFSSPWEA